MAAVVEAEPVDQRADRAISRNTRGRGLPSCGRGVTVPISAKPNPMPSTAPAHARILVEARGDAERVGKRRGPTRSSPAARRPAPSCADKCRLPATSASARAPARGRARRAAAGQAEDGCKHRSFQISNRKFYRRRMINGIKALPRQTHKCPGSSMRTVVACREDSCFQ